MWDVRLSTGVRMLDEQHLPLFNCLQDLQLATAQRAMLATFYAMEQLNRYVKDHFSTEERLMKLCAYPGLTEHMREHRDFCDKLFELRKIYLDHDISTELIGMLRDWLEHHVAKTDQDYVPYLNAPRPAADEGCLRRDTRLAKTINVLEW